MIQTLTSCLICQSRS